MSILRLSNIHLAYGHHPLLAGVDLVLERRERVALVGRNGTGKSSLLKILSGELAADDGDRWVDAGLKVSYLQQEVPLQGDTTVFDIVAAGLPDLDAWERDHRVAAILTSMELPGEQTMAQCSGGIRRRALLAQALVSEPDLLLLDEPTNHLDIEAIAALESALLGYRGTVVFVSHDRALIERLAERMIELDRGRLRSFPGDYQTYLARKSSMLEEEARTDALFDKHLAEEEVWIRQGIQARRTRNEGRVRRLEQLRRDRAERIGPKGQVKLTLDRGSESGALVAELEHVSLSRDEPLIRDFSTRIQRGDRVGIIGPNGCGKTTLLKIILGELEPDKGTVRLGSRLAVAYFDQQREQLRLEESVRANVVEGSDYVEIGGKSRHVIGYLQDFLFDPARANSPVKSLSGGERNRLLLARLFAKPANLLVLDEPTNDLDIETLELLEELLAEYRGTVLMVSHDRAFLDSVVTSTIVFEGGGRLAEYVGGYSDWIRQRPEPASSTTLASPKSAPAREESAASGSRAGVPTTGRRRLGYKETRELAELPARIETLEQQQNVLQALVNDGAFYQREQAEIAARLKELADLDVEIQAAYARWEALESS